MDYGNSSCTPDIMRTMLKGALAINPVGNLLSDDRDTVTISGLVSLWKHGREGEKQLENSYNDYAT